MRALKHIIIWFLIFALLGGAAWYFLIYDRVLTADILTDWGHSAYAEEDYDTAITYYRWAHSLQQQDQSRAITLASAYKASGNYTKAEYTLSNAIAAGGNEAVYLELCRTYVEQNKLLDAVNMLDKIADPNIRASLDAKRPATPTVDITPGFYTQYLTITVTGTDGQLYVSTTDEYPTLEDPGTPVIALGQGQTIITALSIGENGLVSKLGMFGYTVGGVIEVVDLADPNLEIYVRDLLSRGSGSDLTTADLWSITEMTIPQEVTDFSQLHYFTGLTSLTIENQPVVDLSFLSTMEDLKTLDLSGCLLNADQLSLIGALPQLETLDISSCQLSTLNGLNNLTTLRYLNASVNSISDLLPLLGNSNLETLDLQHNAISNFGALGGLEKLSVLNLSNNALTDFSAIATCKGLTQLDVSSNLLTHLTGVNQLKSLTDLNAADNDLTDITGIGGCTSLVNLNLSYNALTTMDEMVSLVNVQDINVSYNDIVTIPDFPDNAALVSFNGCHNFFEDVSGLKDLISLNYVYLDYNNISDINILAGCYNLIQVNVFRTNVTDVSALQEMDVIISYNPT